MSNFGGERSGEPSEGPNPFRAAEGTDVDPFIAGQSADGQGKSTGRNSIVIEERGLDRLFGDGAFDVEGGRSVFQGIALRYFNQTGNQAGPDQASANASFSSQGSTPVSAAAAFVGTGLFGGGSNFFGAGFNPASFYDLGALGFGATGFGAEFEVPGRALDIQAALSDNGPAAPARGSSPASGFSQGATVNQGDGPGVNVDLPPVFIEQPAPDIGQARFREDASVEGSGRAATPPPPQAPQSSTAQSQTTPGQSGIVQGEPQISPGQSQTPAQTPSGQSGSTPPTADPDPEPAPEPVVVAAAVSDIPQDVVEVHGSSVDASGQVIYHAPDASAVGGLVGMTFANNSSSATIGGYVTFGQVFKQGELGASDGLTLLVDGVSTSVQVDVKVTWDDGSVKHAILTTSIDPIAAGTSQDAFLKVGATASGVAPTLSALLASGYDFSFDVDLYDDLGVKTDTAAINVQDLLADPAGNGITITIWLEGPYVSEFSFQYQPDGPEGLEYRVDIRLYDDGTTRTDFSIANEHSFSISETVVYDVVLRQDGDIVFSEAALEHHRNSNWHGQFWDGDRSDAHLQFDIDYMAETGAIPHYETAHGVLDKNLNDDLDANFGPMASGTIQKVLPTTGGRDDIGLLSEWTTDYLISQDERAEYVMMGNADAAGSAPWHFVDETTGEYVDLLARDKLWIDYRHKSGEDALTTTFKGTKADTGWKLDTAHQPSLSFVPYLISGDQYHLNNLIAQATYTIGSVNPNHRDNGESGALFLDGSQQIRGSAWSLRTVTDVAFVLPDGHNLETMFDSSVQGSLDYLVKRYITDGLMDSYGGLEGFFKDPMIGTSGSDAGRTSPWMQDYLTSALGLVASRGYDQANDLLEWNESFLTGRFNMDGDGMNPFYGSAYRFQVQDATTRVDYTTWQDLHANSFDMDSKSSFGSPAAKGTGYISSALGGLTALVTHVGSADAIESYGFVLSEAVKAGAYNVSVQSGYSVDTKWFMMPQMSDGSYLDITNVHVGASMAGSDANELLYGDASGNTISGGNGSDWLFGSDGNDTLQGGGGDDFLFGGFHSDDLYGGAGNDHLKGGRDADRFIYESGDNGDDVIEDFDPALDHLVLSATLGDGSLTLAELLAASSETADGLLLDIGDGDSILLKGLTAADLSASNVDIFG